MSLLDLAQNVLDEVGLPRLTNVFASTDVTARRLKQLANRAGKRLAKAHPWTALHAEHLITVEGSTVEFGFPDDFHRFLPGTHWDRTNTWQQQGPLTPSEWQLLKSGGIAAGIRVRWRVKRGESTLKSVLAIESTLGGSTAATLVFEYVSTRWCRTSDGTVNSAWTADTDLARFDEELIELDLIWRLQKSLGIEYAEDKIAADRAVDMAWAQDGGAPKLSIHGSVVRRTPWPNIPESGFG